MLTSVVQERRVALALVSASTSCLLTVGAQRVSGAPVRVMLAWRNTSRCGPERELRYERSLSVRIFSVSGPDAVARYGEIVGHVPKYLFMYFVGSTSTPPKAQASPRVLVRPDLSVEQPHTGAERSASRQVRDVRLDGGAPHPSRVGQPSGSTQSLPDI